VLLVNFLVNAVVLLLSLPLHTGELGYLLLATLDHPQNLAPQRIGCASPGILARLAAGAPFKLANAAR